MTTNQSAKNILQILNQNGYDAYIVGGAVRDSIMGIEPKDWDIATNATPDQVKALFHTFDSGLKHGTVTAMVDGEGFEITTFRKESGYSDGRHPDSVEFAKTIEEDLMRRDFTINAMAMDINGNLIDPYNGVGDIANEIIRTVGDPNERFEEDALRMLRAIRFSSTLNFEIEENTKLAIHHNCSALSKVSSERIRDELTKILCSPHPEKIKLMAERNDSKSIFDVVLPEAQRMFGCEQLNPNHYLDVGDHTIEVIKHTFPDETIRWAAFLHDIGKPGTKSVNEKTGYDTFYGHAEESKRISNDILRELHFSNREREEILRLVEWHDKNLSKVSKIREFAANHSPKFLMMLKDLKLADIEGQSPFESEKKKEQCLNFHNTIQAVIDDGTAIKKSDIQINGSDLQILGYSGKQIGEYLDNVYKQCLGSPELNDYDKLIKGAASNAVKGGFGSDVADFIYENPDIPYIKTASIIQEQEEDLPDACDDIEIDEQ